jgi:isochorismate synthase EntC
MLRCAVVNPGSSTLDLCAGAGLVAQSTPDAEWQETELKMKTILEML